MSLQEIREQILKDAQKRANAINQEAETEVYRITSDAKAKSKMILDASKKEIAHKSEAMKKEHMAGVEIERNNLVLLAKGSLVDANSSAIKRGIVSIVMDKHYDKIVKNAIASAKDLTNGAELVIKADKESQKILVRLGYKSVLSPDKGVIIQTKDGSIKIDASVESMLSNKDEMIRSKIAEAIFSERMVPVHKEKKATAAPKKAKPAKKVAKKSAKKSKQKRK